MSKNLVELRKKAEKAVRDMRDGDLKVKAFETILTHLLSQHGELEAPNVPGAKKLASAAKAKAAGGRPTSRTDRILSLKADGFFEKQVSIAEIRQELKKNGWHYPMTSVSGPLQALVQRRKLRREQVKEGKRKLWKYSNP